MTNSNSAVSAAPTPANNGTSTMIPEPQNGATATITAPDPNTTPTAGGANAPVSASTTVQATTPSSSTAQADPDTVWGKDLKNIKDRFGSVRREDLRSKYATGAMYNRLLENRSYYGSHTTGELA